MQEVKKLKILEYWYECRDRHLTKIVAKGHFWSKKLSEIDILVTAYHASTFHPRNYFISVIIN